MNATDCRLDPCVSWFRLLARTRGRVLWVFPALLLVGYLAALRRDHPIEGFLARFQERAANAGLLRQARRLNLDYERVLAAPRAYVGKPVVWCVDTPAAERSYVSGRPAWPVALNGAFGAYRTIPGISGYCLNLLAVISGYERGLIQLRPVEKL